MCIFVITVEYCSLILQCALYFQWRNILDLFSSTFTLGALFLLIYLQEMGFFFDIYLLVYGCRMALGWTYPFFKLIYQIILMIWVDFKICVICIFERSTLKVYCRPVDTNNFCCDFYGWFDLSGIENLFASKSPRNLPSYCDWDL